MAVNLKLHIDYISESVRTRNVTQMLLWTHNLMGFYSFSRLAHRMQTSAGGRTILESRPRVTPGILQTYRMESLPEKTFGKLFFDFVIQNGFDKEVQTPP